MQDEVHSNEMNTLYRELTSCELTSCGSILKGQKITPKFDNENNALKYLVELISNNDLENAINCTIAFR